MLLECVYGGKPSFNRESAVTTVMCCVWGRAAIVLALLWLVASRVNADGPVVWIGTETPPGGTSRGIYRTTLDLDSGSLDAPSLAAEMPSPGFLVAHPTAPRLYSICQLADGSGGVAALQILPGPPYLQRINSQPIGDGEAAHINLDATARLLFTAQYGGGSVAVFPLSDDGKILPRSALIEHRGSGPHAQRQEGPHPHWVGTDPTNQYLLVPDLGIDQVVIYKLDLQNGQLSPHGVGRCPPGSGPRHMKFHPRGDLAYVLNELQLTVSVFHFDAAAGALSEIQTIASLPDELREVPCTASELRVHPNGRFVYAASRGHDSITVFAVEPDTGKLSFVEREAIRGSWPRNFNIDPSGKWLLAAGARSATISVFSIDQDTGGLIYSGHTVNCPSPICIEFSAGES